jgi:hypothetical protein
MVTMSQKSSVLQPAKTVSKALTPDKTLKITRSIVLQGAGQKSSILEFVSSTLAGIVVERGVRPNGQETFPTRAII